MPKLSDRLRANVECAPWVVSEVVELEEDLAAAQAKIDSLMLEYCPDEMTPEQMANWERNQKPESE